MGFYANHIVPKLIDLSCSTSPIMKQRAKIVPAAEGEVLEIGIGSGHNFDFYNRDKVKRLIGLEPSAAMRRLASERAQQRGIDVEFIDLSAETIPLDDKSVDTILVTYTLCSIPDVRAALSEMRRVLRPSGSLLFCEHGLAQLESIQKWQRRWEPLWKRIAGGCHLTRDIPKLIEGSGFRLEQLEEMALPNTPAIAGYNYWGRALTR